MKVRGLTLTRQPPELTNTGCVLSPAIDTTDLTRDFDAFRAVDHPSLRVERGRFYGFLGPNGAGKSTTMVWCRRIWPCSIISPPAST